MVAQVHVKLIIQVERSEGIWGIAPELIRLKWSFQRKENVVTLGQRSRQGLIKLDWGKGFGFYLMWDRKSLEN